jgi:hypothetical protein
MAAQLLPIVFWALIVLALAGTFFDVRAVRVEDARAFGAAAIALKAAVALAFGGWWAYFRLLNVRLQGFGDLAALVSIMLLAIPVLAAALVCEGLALRRMRRAG